MKRGAVQRTHRPPAQELVDHLRLIKRSRAPRRGTAPGLAASEVEHAWPGSWDGSSVSRGVGADADTDDVHNAESLFRFCGVTPEAEQQQGPAPVQRDRGTAISLLTRPVCSHTFCGA